MCPKNKIVQNANRGFLKGLYIQYTCLQWKISELERYFAVCLHDLHHYQSSVNYPNFKLKILNQDEVSHEINQDIKL